MEGKRAEGGDGGGSQIQNGYIYTDESRLVVARGCQKRKQEVICSKDLSLFLRW